MRSLPFAHAPTIEEYIRLERSQKTPRANAEPPRLNEPLDILRELLDIERDRLTIAQRIEDERNIVFPETSVIIHDILKLTREIENRCTNNVEKITCHNSKTYLDYDILENIDHE